MPKVKVNYAFQDIHTQAVYEAGSVQEFTAERVAEIHQNLPGFISEVADRPVDEVEKPKKKGSRKATVVDDEPAVN